MARGFFTGSGFFSAPDAPPDAYLALVEAFGSEAAADFYVNDLVGYATGDEAQDLLDVARAAGTAAEAIAILGAGGPQTFAEIAAGILDADCVTLILPTPAANPYVEDLAGTFEGSDFNTAIQILTGGEAGGYAARTGTSTNSGVSAPVQITGALTVHIVFTDTTEVGGNAGYLGSQSGTGELESGNYLWSAAVGSSYYGYFVETGVGTNVSASWIRTQTASKSRTILLTITRSSGGRVRLYENGTLLVCQSVSAGTIGPAGAYADLALPTGGSATSLWLNSDPTEAPPNTETTLLGVYSVEQSAAKVLEIAQTLGFA